MESVLVLGRIKPSRRRRAEGILASGRLIEDLVPGLTRHSVFRQGENVALLFEGPGAELGFVRLLEEGPGELSRLIECLESVPLLPRELYRVVAPSPARAFASQ